MLRDVDKVSMRDEIPQKYVYLKFMKCLFDVANNFFCFNVIHL